MKLITRLQNDLPAERLLLGEPMSRHTSFRIGGAADALFLPATAEELTRAIAAAEETGAPWRVLGNGTNVLVRDGGLRGLTIVLGEPMSGVRIEGRRVTAQAGALLSRVGREAQRAGLQGMAALSGIPGSVGGAAAMNAGAYGSEMKDVLTRVLALENGQPVWLDADALALSYRDSLILRHGLIVLAAEFELQGGDPDVIQAEMADYAARRREKQPLNMPSAGSTFKRPAGHFAGALIEGAGLKGYRVGGAQVSELHAGFVVNAGGATARDVLALMDDVRRIVFEQTGVTLEPEVRVIGEDG
ncbi:MAG: UDP-N-acetylmuramate dehydrogenase [Clostridiales bacterium]|nr:UDP-N-acetylmuramate dehydrogenase [Clostridiales bacterium]MDY2872071.1 UDP-N-acetylmuramate dehydrogenase [Eubacteriales bacterium]